MNDPNNTDSGNGGSGEEQKPLTYKAFNKMLDDRPPEWRRGQAAFNFMTDIDAEFAESIRGTPLDPYFDDKKLECFFGAAFMRGVIK